MKRKTSSQLEPSMSPEVSQDSIDPQLRQPSTKRPALSFVEGKHTTSAADDYSIDNPPSSSEHGESTIDDEDADFEEDDEDATQVYAAAQKMVGVGRLATMHGDTGDLHAGFKSYMVSRRTLDIPNDDHAELVQYNSTYVRHIYNAITTIPASMTYEQTRMVNLWGKKLDALGDDADQYMSDLASMLVAAIYALHSTGDVLFDAQFDSLKPHEDDSTMTALQRVEIICDVLHNYKKHVVDLMAGFDAVTKFVAAPKGIAKRKATYQSNNESKKARLNRLEALAKAAKDKARDEEDGEDEDDD